MGSENGIAQAITSDLLSALRSIDVADDAPVQLAPERQLALEYKTSRAEVRKALAVLEAEGRVKRRVGQGTFLTPARKQHASVLDEIAQSVGPRDVMHTRLIIEPELAGLAAVNASHKQIQSLRRISAETRASDSWASYEETDLQFHRLIAECAGNALLLSVFDIINEVRRTVVWKWLDTRQEKPPADYSSFSEHDAIIDAIEKRDRAEASAAMQAHLITTNSRLLGQSGKW